MKTIYRRAAIFALVATFIVFVINLVITIGNEDYSSLCEPGSGITTIKGRVVDHDTNKLIDSVRLKVRYGASMDYIADTVLKQNNGISFDFNIPENDCENYWYEVSNRHYAEEIIFADSLTGYLVKKGATTEFVASLKPATTIRLTLERELQNDSPDTVTLYISENNERFERWDRYSKADFMEKDTGSYISTYYAFEDVDGKRKISTDFNLESNISYSLKWIRKEHDYIDTIYTQLEAKPFDTLYLNYEFRKIKR